MAAEGQLHLQKSPWAGHMQATTLMGDGIIGSEKCTPVTQWQGD